MAAVLESRGHAAEARATREAAVASDRNRERERSVPYAGPWSKCFGLHGKFRHNSWIFELVRSGYKSQDVSFKRRLKIGRVYIFEFPIFSSTFLYPKIHVFFAK